MTPGGYHYAYTFATAGGETAPSADVSITVDNEDPVRTQVPLELGGAGVIARKVYRTKADGVTLFLLATVSNNEDTEFIDENTPDSELGTQAAPVYDSTASVHRIARPHPDWGSSQPTAGFLLEGRMAAILGHFLYISARGDHEDFLSQPLAFPVYTGKGEGVIAGISWRQQGWLFKRPRGIYRVDCSDLDPELWQVHEHTDAVGIAGPMALTLIQGATDTQFFDDVIFAAPDGSHHRLSKVGAYQEGDVNAASISEATYGKFIRENVDTSRLHFCQAIYFDAIEEVQFAVTPKGGAVNSMRLKANIKRLPEFGVRYHHSTFPECEALALKRDTDGIRRPIAGGTGGFVRKLHENVYSDAGVAYTSEWWTADDNFRSKGQAYERGKKNYHHLIVEGLAVGDWTMFIEVYIDGVRQPTILEASMRGKDATALVLDEGNFDEEHLDSRKPVFVALRLRGRGNRIALRGYVSTTGQYFRISQVQIGFSPAGFSGGERASSGGSG